MNPPDLTKSALWSLVSGLSYAYPGRIIIIIFNLMRGRRRGHSTISSSSSFSSSSCYCYYCCCYCCCALFLRLDYGSHFLPFASSFSTSFFPISFLDSIYIYFFLLTVAVAVVCTPCNATLYAAVDAFRGFCVYAMLSLGIPNARGHRQSLHSLFSPVSLSLCLSIGTCVLAFASLILPTTCSMPICLVGFPFSPFFPFSALLCVVLRFKHGARSF